MVRPSDVDDPNPDPIAIDLDPISIDLEPIETDPDPIETDPDPMATDPCSFVTQYWVEKVFKTVDTPLRTHRITLSYSKFAVCLDSKLFRDWERCRRIGEGGNSRSATPTGSISPPGAPTRSGPTSATTAPRSDSTHCPTSSGAAWHRPSFRAGRLTVTWWVGPWPGARS